MEFIGWMVGLGIVFGVGMMVALPLALIYWLVKRASR